MTQTPLPPLAPAATHALPARADRLRRVLRGVAIVACIPYLSLKTAWVLGSHIGIPEGSTLLDPGASLRVANAATVLMDAAVIVLALLFTRPWGLRVPVWLLALPMWVATGLLTPIMVGYPLQVVVRLLGSTAGTSEHTGREPFLDDWVFGVVYTGFIVQGLTLGTLFVLYARDRWGHLWRGQVGDLPGSSPTRPAQQAAAVAASLLTLIPLTTHLLWACGVTAGLNAARIEEPTGDFYALEAVYVLFAAATAAGVLMIAFRRGRTLPLTVPLALAFTGSAALACWGGWLMTASLDDGDPGRRLTQLMNLSYSVQMIVGTLVVTIGAYFFAERGAVRPPGQLSQRIASR
jgi:hypothetical protein